MCKGVTITLDGCQLQLLRDVFQKSLGNKLISAKDAADFRQLFHHITRQINCNCKYQCHEHAN